MASSYLPTEITLYILLPCMYIPTVSANQLVNGSRQIHVRTILFLMDGEKKVLSSLMRYSSCFSLLNGAVK